MPSSLGMSTFLLVVFHPPWLIINRDFHSLGPFSHGVFTTLSLFSWTFAQSLWIFTFPGAFLTQVFHSPWAAFHMGFHYSYIRLHMIISQSHVGFHPPWDIFHMDFHYSCVTLHLFHNPILFHFD